MTRTMEMSAPDTTRSVMSDTGPLQRNGKGKRRIVAILPRGEAIRNFVYTGAVEEAARNAEIDILSVVPSSQIGDLLRERYPSVTELSPVGEHRLVGMVRDLLDMAHGRWLWSEAAKERWRLRDEEAHTRALWLKRTLKKGLCYPFASRVGLALLSKAETASSRWLRTTDEYVHLLERLQPTLVFNASHVHSHIANPVIHAARELGIPTAAFIFSWDNLTSQGRIMPPYDYYLVWNEAIRDQLLEIYDSVAPHQVFVTGTPQFDFLFRPEYSWSREEFCRRVGADARRPIVLYSTGMPNHMPDEPAIVEGIADVVRGMTDLGPPQLLVRVYPKDQTGRFGDLARRRPDILFPKVPWEPEWQTPTLEDAYLFTSTLKHSAVGINIASTVTLELCMLDKPVINVSYQPGERTGGYAHVDYRRYYQFDHYRPVVQSGAVTVASSEEEMGDLLRAALVDPGRHGDQRRSLIATMFGAKLDGYSAVRVADRLVRLAEVGSPKR
jgi:hypothetical protein